MMSDAHAYIHLRKSSPDSIVSIVTQREPRSEIGVILCAVSKTNQDSPKDVPHRATVHSPPP